MALLGANVVSVVGGAMSLVALPWFVLTTTGSPARTGIAAACETVPVVASSVVAGWVVDQLGPRRTRVLSDAVSGVAVLAVPVLHTWVGLAYWQLLILVAVNGALRTPAVAASLLLLTSISRPSGSGRPAETGAYAASVSIAATAGAPLAGAMIGVAGAPAVLVVDAATFAVSAAVIWLFIPDPPTPQRRPVGQSGATGLRRGVQILRHDHALGLLSVIAVVMMVLDAGWSAVLAPLYGQRVLDSPSMLGLLLGAFGLGVVMGNLGYQRVTARVRLHRLLWLVLLVQGPLRFAALAAHPALPILAAVLLAAGAAAGLLTPFALDLQYQRVAAELHGHLFGLTYGMSQAGVAAGAVLAGAIANALPLQTALLLLAVLALLTVAAAAARPLRTEAQTTSGIRGTGRQAPGPDAG